MSNLEKALKQAILRLELKPNTMVFVDRTAINIRELTQAIECLPLDVENSFFVPIHVAPGKTIAEAIAVATDEQKREWTELAKS